MDSGIYAAVQGEGSISHRIVDDVPGVGNQLVILLFKSAVPRPGGAERIHLCQPQQYSVFQQSVQNLVQTSMLLEFRGA